MKTIDLLFSMDKCVGLGVIGVGRIGRLHAANLVSLGRRATLIGIADLNIKVAKRLASALRVEHVCGDYSRLLEHKQIEAVVIAVPTHLKHEIIVEAAKYGKHVFVEKPMALDLREANDVIKRIRKSGVKLQVGYQRRFDRAHLLARDHIIRGRIGELLIVKSCTRDPPTNRLGWTADYKKSGGIMLDTCSHDFDAIRFLTGSEVTRIYAEVNSTSGNHQSQRRVDNAIIVLRLGSGALGHVEAYGHAVYGYDVRVEALGTKGGVFIGTHNISEARVIKRRFQQSDCSASFEQRFGAAYLSELEHFIDCVQRDKEPEVSAGDGKAAIEVGAAATLSFSRGVPVNLPLEN
jgi:predicted dehydrogenase